MALDPATLPALLAARDPVVIPPGDAARRAAVTLLLAPAPEAPEDIEALFVLRADVTGDPWSGHVALPGGREEPEDADLLATARRELREETAIDLPAAAYTGRLDELHPRSAHLPSIAVTPYVAWHPEQLPVSENYELAGHLWIPLSELAAPARRAQLDLTTPELRTFETIEYAGATVWGMTLAIIDDFLRRIGGEGHDPRC